LLISDVVLKQFYELLQERLERGVLTTEDSVRYSFFLSLVLNSKIKPRQVIQEYPHPKIKKAKIDTWINVTEQRSIAIEFKYHRGIPSGRSTAKPQSAGKAFKDLSRLGSLGVDAYFIHLCAAKMSNYLSRRRNGLTEYFDCKTGDEIFIGESFYKNKSATFLKKVDKIFTVEMKCCLAASLANEHELRVYKINPNEFSFI